MMSKLKYPKRGIPEPRTPSPRQFLHRWTQNGEYSWRRVWWLIWNIPRHNAAPSFRAARQLRILCFSRNRSCMWHEQRRGMKPYKCTSTQTASPKHFHRLSFNKSWSSGLPGGQEHLRINEPRGQMRHWCAICVQEALLLHSEGVLLWDWMDSVKRNFVRAGLTTSQSSHTPIFSLSLENSAAPSTSEFTSMV